MSDEPNSTPIKTIPAAIGGVGVVAAVLLLPIPAIIVAPLAILGLVYSTAQLAKSSERRKALKSPPVDKTQEGIKDGADLQLDQTKQINKEKEITGVQNTQKEIHSPLAEEDLYNFDGENMLWYEDKNGIYGVTESTLLMAKEQKIGTAVWQRALEDARRDPLLESNKVKINQNMLLSASKKLEAEKQQTMEQSTGKTKAHGGFGR